MTRHAILMLFVFWAGVSTIEAQDAAAQRTAVFSRDIAEKKRGREYRFEDTPIGNGDVAATGEFFLGLNYGQLARLRAVTGYPRV